jgi:hypothetical protein
MIWWVVVIALGFEPRTVCLEGRCSIQLSYATFYFFGATHLNLTVPIENRNALIQLSPASASGKYANKFLRFNIKDF